MNYVVPLPVDKCVEQIVDIHYQLYFAYEDLVEERDRMIDEDEVDEVDEVSIDQAFEEYDKLFNQSIKSINKHQEDMIIGLLDKLPKDIAKLVATFCQSKADRSSDANKAIDYFFDFEIKDTSF